MGDFHVKSTRKLTNTKSSYKLEPAELSEVLQLILIRMFIFPAFRNRCSATDVDIAQWYCVPLPF